MGKGIPRKKDKVIITHKIKENKAIIQNKINKKLFQDDYNAKLLKPHDIDILVRKKMKELKCSELEASELLRKGV